MSLLPSLGPHPHPSVGLNQLVGGLGCSVVVKAPQRVEGLLVSTWQHILLLHWDQVGRRHDLGRARHQSCDLEVLLYNLEGVGLQTWEPGVHLYDLGWVGRQSLAVHHPDGCTPVGRSHSGPGRVHRLQRWTGRWLAHDSAALHSHWASGYTQCLQGRVAGLEWRGLGEGAGLQHLRV